MLEQAGMKDIVVCILLSLELSVEIRETICDREEQKGNEKSTQGFSDPSCH